LNENEGRAGQVHITYDPASHIGQWLEGSFAKIVVGVDSEEELLAIHQKAKDMGLVCSLIRDAGRTEFHNEPTYTCVAVGPGKDERIDDVTGHLKLL
jgi:PTH2 family peptidyl-tRNA hydrolase